MKKIKVLFMMLAAALFIIPVASAQNKTDDILGKWLNEDEDAHIEITKRNDMYYGKLVWLKDPIDEETGKPKVDDDNPDPKLQNRPVLGLEILTDFVFDKDEWEDGNIYDPKTGKTYDCYMKFVEENKIKIRGYVLGITLLGRTTYWTRVNE